MKNWLLSAAKEMAGDLAITALILAVSALLHGIDLTIRASIGPQFAALAWVLSMLIALVAIAAYLIKQGNKHA